MRRYAGWLVFALCAYLGWLLATLPLGPVLTAARQAGAPLQLAGATGSLWSGQATQLAVQGLVLGGVQWDFAPSGLLRGRLAFDVSFRDAGGAGLARLALGPGGELEVRALSGKLDAARVAPLLPVPVGLAGDLVFDDLSLRLDGGRPDAAEGQLRWLGAALGQPFPLDIGAVELVFEEADTGIAARYSGGGEAFSLEGSLSADAEQGYRTETLITPRDPQLGNWLQGMGLARVGKGYRVVHTGTW